MSDNNPYTAPSANVEQNSFVEHSVQLLPAPVGVAAGRGWGWIKEGFAYFKRSWGGWVLGMIVGLILVVGLQFIPVIGPVIYFLSVYILVGGVMLGCHAQSQGQPFEVKHLFAAFKKPTKLIILSVVMLILTIVIMLALLGPGYLSLLTSQGDPEAAEAAIAAMGDPKVFLLRTLFGMLLFIPISMAVWFAPALIVINDVSLVKALKLSFIGCLKNVVPFLLFGLIGFVFYILAIIPLALGLFVFFPTFTAATYIAYREIFTERA